MLIKHTLEEFNKVLGSSSAAPGGGSVAALSGALGAALVSMVCNLTVGKENFETSRDELIKVLSKSQSLSQSLLKRVDLDTEAFNEVMAAFKLPKVSDADKQERTKAIQSGYKNAIQSPLGIARECLEVLKLAESLLGRSNTNAISDLGVASQQAYAGLEGAILNVKINIPSIKDQEFVRQALSDAATLLNQGSDVAKKVHTYVLDNIN